MAKRPLKLNHTWDYNGTNSTFVSSLPNRTFGSFLKERRVARGMPRRALAVRAAIEEKRLMAIELNQSPPSYREIRSLASVLRLPERELLEAAGCVRPENGA